MSLRERKKEATRQALMEAAGALFARDGYTETSVDAIAEAVGISRRTFFRYFPSKEAVAFPWHTTRLSAFLSTVAARDPAEAPLAAVQRACVQLARSFVADRDAVVAHHAMVLASPALVAADRLRDLEWEEAVAESLLATRVHGDAQDRLRARLVAGAVMGMVRTALRAWFASGGQLDLVGLAQQGFALLERGVGDARREDLR